LNKQKPPCPAGRGRLWRCKTYCFFSVDWSALPPEAAPDPLVLPPEVEPLVDGLLEPPEAESFFVASADEEELEDDGELGGVAPALLEEDEGGVLGFTVAEPDVELEPDGAVAEPDGVVEPLDEEDDAPGWVRARSPASSPQAASRLAPKTIDTATAKVESLMLWASLVGMRIRKQGSRLTR
jgi:hypothetical protein